MRHRHFAASWLAAGLAAAAPLGGCGDDDGGGPDAGADAGPVADAAPRPDGAEGPLAGEVELLEVSAYGTRAGQVVGALSTTGLTGWHREVLREGDCRLLRFQPAFCDQPCAGMCVDTNVCQPYPTYAEAGTLTFSGTRTPVSVVPGDSGFNLYGYYWWSDAQPDLFSPGDAITARFAGGEIAAFSVEAVGVAPLALISVPVDELALPNGADVAFTWDPAGGTPDTRLRLTLNANSAGGHGSPYEAIIECDAPDTGSLTIPQAIVEGFPETHRWEVCAGKDCPLSTAVRYGRGEALIAAGRVELRVGSSASFYVLHDPI